MNNFVGATFNKVTDLVQQSNVIGNVADKLLSAIVPQENADAAVCGYWYVDCGCYLWPFYLRRKYRLCRQGNRYYYQYRCTARIC